MCIQIKSWKDLQKLDDIQHEIVDEIVSGSDKYPTEEVFYSEVIRRYELLLENEEDFFTQLAKLLRDLWPAGDKDGKWPWRDSVDNLSRRLKTLWKVRDLGDYSIEECVSVANRYLARFQDSVKYMKILKYFILKQSKISKPNGKVTYINDSVLADMLEGKSDEDAIQNEWEKLLNNADTCDGVVI